MGVPSVENERILLLDLFVEYSEVASLKAGHNSIEGIRNCHVQEHQINVNLDWSCVDGRRPNTDLWARYVI